LKQVEVRYSFNEGQWSAETDDFGIGYSHPELNHAKEVITKSVYFFYENEEIEIIEKIAPMQNQAVI
jgi:hypothetical protein